MEKGLNGNIRENTLKSQEAHKQFNQLSAKTGNHPELGLLAWL